MKSIVEVLEKNIREREEARKKEEEEKAYYIQWAIDCIKSSLSEKGYDPESVKFAPTSYWDYTREVAISLSPKGYYPSRERRYPVNVTCKFKNDKIELMPDIDSVIEKLVNPLYWEKIPEPQPELGQEYPAVDEVEEIKEALRKILDWAGIWR